MNDTYDDRMIGNLAVFEVGLSSQDEGFDTVCMGLSIGSTITVWWVTEHVYVLPNA
ncbi:MAG: hypothetical protein OSA23_06395 [Rhodospirillales bacterium]|nr:hypothetical protein [Rhodospirillales bacterium]